MASFGDFLADVAPYAGAGIGGALGGPAGAAIGYGAGGVVGDFLNQGDVEEEQRKKQKLLREIAARYASERGRLVPLRTAGVNQQLGAMQGGANALATMYGMGATMPQSPRSMPGMQRR